MKTIFKIFLLTLTSFNSFSQEIKIPELNWGTRVIANDESIVVSGISFKNNRTEKFASLICYDLELNKIWQLTLDSKQTNSVDTITFWENKIIISGTEGKEDNQSVKKTRFIKIISSDGKNLAEINIGNSTSKSTDFIIQKNTLFLGYKKSSSINYGDMMKTSMNTIVEVNLTNLKYKIYEHYLNRSTPEFIFASNKNIFICGEQFKNDDYNVTQTFFQNIKNTKPIDNLLPADKMESLGSGITTKNGFILVSSSNIYEKKAYEYLRIDALNFKGKLRETKIIPFKELGWLDRTPDFLNIENKLWFRVKKEDKKTYLVQLNSSGKEISAREFKGDRRGILTMNSESIIHLWDKEETVRLKKYNR
ncbi:hypothetical protein [Tenacibaculum sp. 190524A05c]|uniref:TolB-like protein n=1 Tax=Tenacibaculum platacis TaxID=3137852 RepID=A0ABM9P0E8_9FLAO